MRWPAALPASTCRHGPALEVIDGACMRFLAGACIMLGMGWRAGICRRSCVWYAALPSVQCNHPHAVGQSKGTYAAVCAVGKRLRASTCELPSKYKHCNAAHCRHDASCTWLSTRTHRMVQPLLTPEPFRPLLAAWKPSASYPLQQHVPFCSLLNVVQLVRYSLEGVIASDDSCRSRRPHNTVVWMHSFCS